MTNIAEMLKEEQKRSDDFTRTNFGLKIGDGFPELVREIAADKDLSAKMMLTWMLSQIMSSFDIKKVPLEKPENVGSCLLDMPSAYEPRLEMLYWGIQIGRRLEREEAAALASVQRASE